MKSIALFLYFLGLLGIFLSILMLTFKIHKKGNFLNILSITILLISFISLGSGTVLSLLNLKASNSTMLQADNTENTESNLSNIDESNYQDLSLIYNIASNNSQAFITIKNNSSLVFNGNVTIKLLDKNKTVLSTVILPVKNLLPTNSINSTIFVDKQTSYIEYLYSGGFTNLEDIDNIYYVKNISINNDYMRFEVSVKDISLSNLEKISKEFKENYPKDLCKGFLVYYLENETDNFSSAYADFFGNNENNTYTLTTFSNNSKYKIR